MGKRLGPSPSPSPSLADADALDRIAAAMRNGLPDGLRAATEMLEEVQRLVRYTGREAGRQFDDADPAARHG